MPQFFCDYKNKLLKTSNYYHFRVFYRMGPERAENYKSYSDKTQLWKICLKRLCWKMDKIPREGWGQTYLPSFTITIFGNSVTSIRTTLFIT